jgi:hypothetical protein
MQREEVLLAIGRGSVGYEQYRGVCNEKLADDFCVSWKNENRD